MRMTATEVIIRRAIQPFKAQREILVETISKYGGCLHQDDFNKEFNQIQIKDGKPYMRAQRWSGWAPLNAPILGDMSGSEWSKWLELLQLMVRVGDVEIKGKLPDVCYCLPDAE